MSFSQRLRELRTEHKLSQKNLAQILEIDHQTISRLERDYNEPNLDILIKLADYFGCSVDYLLGREREDGRIIINRPNEEKKTIIPNELENIYKNLSNRNRNLLCEIANAIARSQ